MDVSTTHDQQAILQSEQELQKYHQRDMMPSHVYRVGMKIFGKTPPIRRRIINCSLSDMPISAPKQTRFITQPNATKTLSSPLSPSYDEYRALIKERQQMRHTLDSIGAHEQWLSSKECTPIEAKLLTKLKKEREQRRIKPPPTPIESSESEEDELTPSELRLLKVRERNKLLKDIHRLQMFLKICRTRIAELVVPYDTRKIYLIPSKLLYEYLVERLLPPSMSLEAVVILCKTLEKETQKKGYIDYRILFSDNLEDMIIKYLQEKDKHSTVIKVEEPDEVSIKSEQAIEDDSTTTNSKAFSTLDGEIGEWAVEVKDNAQKQFTILLEYCFQNDIILDKKLAKRALLTPLDKTRQDCLKHIRQPGTGLITRKMIDPPRGDNRKQRDTGMDYSYGWQYQQVRGPFKSKLMRLSTGTVRVKAKTDNWLTYSEFEEITKEIQSRPGFNYKYHGLPPDSAFWPGALQDKLRLYLPKETLKTKSSSLYNIFQPVDNPKISSKHTSVLPTEKGTVWPVNDSGYVQLGGSLARTRKTYIV